MAMLLRNRVIVEGHSILNEVAIMIIYMWFIRILMKTECSYFSVIPLNVL